MVHKGAILAVGLIAVAGLASSAPEPPSGAGRSKPAWTEVAWPFLLDQWGPGRAFQCGAGGGGGACPFEINIYVRPKVGFCDCANGVSDDAELDRINDVALLGDNFAPLVPGEKVNAGWMKGRARTYYVSGTFVTQRYVLAVGLNSGCDAFVATITADHSLTPDLQRAALEFLNHETVLRWARKEFGLS